MSSHHCDSSYAVLVRLQQDVRQPEVHRGQGPAGQLRGRRRDFKFWRQIRQRRGRHHRAPDVGHPLRRRRPPGMGLDRIK